ncbi:hypothetical protein TNCV_2225491 [Trichonephila clavipes]|nr:hypothetical protein TNCV_2225491 [Trichonephila clavipes]
MKAIEPAAVASSLEDSIGLRYRRVTVSNLRRHLVKIPKCFQANREFHEKKFIVVEVDIDDIITANHKDRFWIGRSQNCGSWTMNFIGRMCRVVLERPGGGRRTLNIRRTKSPLERMVVEEERRENFRSIPGVFLKTGLGRSHCRFKLILDSGCRSIYRPLSTGGSKFITRKSTDTSIVLKSVVKMAGVF